MNTNKIKKITVMVPMRDSIRLAMDIYFPDDTNIPRPVIMERTPYGRMEPSDYDLESAEIGKVIEKKDVATYFNAAGLVVCFQDVRGRYDSEGDFVKYLNEANDGLDTLQWIKAQPWCNGKIGLMGFSYTSHAATALGCLSPSDLSTLFIDSGGFSNAYLSGIRQGGVLELKQLIWAFNQAKVSPLVVENPAIHKALLSENIFSWMKRFPLKKAHSLLRLIPEYEDIVFDFWKREKYDSFWKQLGINTGEFYARFADIPMLLMTGWYDPYVKTILDNYIAFSSNMKSPIFLLVGPWTHNNRGLRIVGDVDMGPESSFRNDGIQSYEDLKRKWFDYVFSGAEKPFLQHKVSIFIMGGGSGKKTEQGHLIHGGKWIFSDTWPVKGSKEIPFFFHKDGSLSKFRPNNDFAYQDYIYDPSHPVPSIGGTITSGEPIMRGGAYNQVEAEEFFGSEEPFLPLEARTDVLVYQTEILEREIQVCGAISVKLWISSDCVDTDFTFKLIDVYPPNDDYPQGYAMNITDGIKRMRFRNSYKVCEMMEAGEIYEAAIDAFATANLFNVGHRIRVDISSSNFPHFDINHNTGDPDGEGQVLLKARNRVYMDCIRSSRIIMPILN